MSCIRKFLLADTIDGEEFDSLPVTQCDGACLVQQQRIYVACSFYRLSAHRQHVVLHDTVHAGYADGGQQAADGCRYQANEQGNQNRYARNCSRTRLRNTECGERLQRDHRQHEDHRQSGNQDVERDLIRSLLTFCALDQSNHAIEKSLAGVGRNPNLDLV